MSREDWIRLGGVLALGIALSLIGLAIASGFEPQTGLGPEASETTTTTSAERAQSATTSTIIGTRAPATGSSTTAPVEPASLTLSQEVVDFGADEDVVEVDVSNKAGGGAVWSLSSDGPGITVDPSQGELAPGDTATVAVSLDRTQIGEGEYTAVLTLTWGDGEIATQLTAVNEDNPIIHNPTASPSTVAAGGDCGPRLTTISARVRDTSELAQVVVRWSPDGSTTRETAMNAIGNDMYEGQIGPYDTARTDLAKVVAFDVRDNAGGASLQVTVEACP